MTMTTDEKHIVAHDLYQELSQPFANDAENKAAVEAFFAAVRRLRKKHRIANVLLLSGTFVTLEPGKVALSIGQSTNGDDFVMPILARAAHGDWQERTRKSLELVAFQRSAAGKRA